jgi:hypothetical protein
MISVCSARDIAVARAVVPHILEFIPSKTYVFAVPAADMGAFRSSLPSAVTIVCEDDFLEGRSFAAINAILPQAAKWRTGWYLQQFVKIAACRAAGETTLIWDADTIPLRALRFGEDGDCISAYAATEYFPLYFSTLKALTGLERNTPQSFIAQCLCVRSYWTNSLIADIETHTGRHWMDAILANVTGVTGAEFSEYETIGNYVLHKYPDQLRFNARRWSRQGYRLVGDPDTLTPADITRLGRVYDFIAFENSQKQSHWGKILAEKALFLLRAQIASISSASDQAN